MMAPPDCIFMRRGGKKQAFKEYTGTYTTSEVTGTDGKKYTLYTITSSGTLTLADAVQFWMCGGGATGAASSASTYDKYGGAGAYAETGELPPGTHVITIGAADSDSTIQSEGSAITAKKAEGKNGGTGGGDSSGNSVGTGDGISKIPFGIESLAAHCGGGGSGGAANFTMEDGNTGKKLYWVGGNGGTNGGNGQKGSNQASAAESTIINSSLAKGGTGGEKGGGKGGTCKKSNSGCNGGAATFYGSGGGGGARLQSSTDVYYGKGGTGYQGVLYLLIPAA